MWKSDEEDGEMELNIWEGIKVNYVVAPRLIGLHAGGREENRGFKVGKVQCCKLTSKIQHIYCIEDKKLQFKIWVWNAQNDLSVKVLCSDSTLKFPKDAVL